LLLNELPGTAARARLSAGENIGGTVLELDLQNTPEFGFDASLDRDGSPYTGRWRASGGAAWANPSGAGDQLSLRVLASSGLHYLRAGYSLPLGTDGLKAQAYALGLGYNLGGSFGVLQAKGGAREFGAGLNYALERSGAATKDVSVSLSSKRLDNQTIAGKTSDKRVSTASVGYDTLQRFAGDTAQHELSTQVGINLGKLDLSRLASDQAADALGPKAQGQFTKVRLSAQWRAEPAPSWRSTVGVQAQLANTNLDSGEQFSLGGANGVRGYANGEASGDAGWLASAQLTRQLTEQFSAFAGVDSGRIMLHKRLWTNWQGNRLDLPNRYALSSVAIGAQWRIPGWSAALTVAKPTGGNPGADASGLNSDGSGKGARVGVLLNWVM
jgi:hemolysin activation/secretion protein